MIVGGSSRGSSRPGARKTLTDTCSGASEVTAGCEAAGDAASIDSRSGQRRIFGESGAGFKGGGDRRFAIGGQFDPPPRAVAVEPLALPAFVEDEIGRAHV